MNYILSYDIRDNRLRLALAKVFLRNGCKRIQKSVFLAPGFSKKELEKMQLEVRLLVQKQPLQEAESIICIPIQKQYLDALVWEGDADTIQGELQKVYHLLV